jgi:hypothetical protein
MFSEDGKTERASSAWPLHLSVCEVRPILWTPYSQCPYQAVSTPWGQRRTRDRHSCAEPPRAAPTLEWIQTQNEVWRQKSATPEPPNHLTLAQMDWTISHSTTIPRLCWLSNSKLIVWHLAATAIHRPNPWSLCSVVVQDILDGIACVVAIFGLAILSEGPKFELHRKISGQYKRFTLGFVLKDLSSYWFT